MFKVFKKIILSIIYLYTFNLIAQSMNIVLPINYLTIGYISYFGPIGILSLITIFLLAY